MPAAPWMRAALCAALCAALSGLACPAAVAADIALKSQAPAPALALPAVGEQLLNMTVGLVDTFMVGHLGASSVAAVGLAN